MSKRGIQPRYITRKAVGYISELLAISPAGQDWGIERADPNRIDEFLQAYEQLTLDDDERFALMSLIIASYDDLLRSGGGAEPEWIRIKLQLLERFALHECTIQDWSLPDEDNPENFFHITQQVREIMHTVFGAKSNWPRKPVVIKRFCESPMGMAANCVEIIDMRNDSGYSVWWSSIEGRESGERRFARIEHAQEWAERELGVKSQEWAIA